MEKKTFEISHIQSVDELNSLSLALNEKEQVSHMKISQNTIVFNCIDIDALMSLIQSVNKEFVVKEVVDGDVKNYDFAKRQPKKHYFMFKNVMTEDDIRLLAERLTSQFDDVEYDEANKLLMLTSDKRDVISYVRKELFQINPSIEIIEHSRPIRSQDVFNQKYLSKYIRIAIFIVVVSLAFITSKDNNPILPIVLWSITVLLLGEKLIKHVFKDIRHGHFFKESVLVFLAMVLGVASGNYLETCIAIVLYQFMTPLLNKVLEKSLEKIDAAAEIPETGIRIEDGVEEEIPLSEFEINDVMVVNPGETVHMSGRVEYGLSTITTYSNTSKQDKIKVVCGSEVHSGEVNIGDKPIHVRIHTLYQNTNYIELMNRASKAPVYESKTEKYTKTLSKIYTPLMFLLAIGVGVVLPIIDYREFGSLIHVGAILLLVSSSLSSDQAASLGVLAGFAKAFQDGIVVESSLGLDSINATQTIVYDRFDGVEVTDEELELFRKLSHMGKILVIFNDGPVALENDQYTIYNDLSVEEKLEKMDSFIGPVVYIGDSYKDIQLLQKSFVGISRGGLSDMKVVENSDIVLLDSALNKVYETFVIARKMRTNALISNVFTVVMKLVEIILMFSFVGLPIWIIVLIEILVKALVIKNSTSFLK